MTTVSVVMPMYDAARTLAATLESLRAQTFQDFELVLVDDGSADETQALARELWPEAQLLTPGRVGLVAALNLGLAHARAPLIARLDADDLAAPERLAKQVAFMRANPDVDILATRVRCFSSGVLGEGFRLYEAWMNGLTTHDDIMRELWIESPLAHPSVMMRRALIDALGGYHDAGWPEDYDLWLRAAHSGARFAKLSEVLVDWRDHPARATRTQRMYAQEAHLRCKAYHLARGPLLGVRTVVWGAGAFGKRLGRELRAHGVPVVGYVDIDPRKVGKTRGGLPVVAPEALPGLEAQMVLAAVGTRGARETIRAALVEVGWVEGRDFLCVA